MKKVLLSVAMATALMGGSVAVAVARPDAPADHHTMLATSFGPIVSHDRTLRGTVVESPVADASGEGRWIVELRTMHNRRVSRAQVHVVAYMPEDSDVPARRGMARYIGKGRYEVAGLDVDRAGWWNIALTVRRGPAADSLAFNLLMR